MLRIFVLSEIKSEARKGRYFATFVGKLRENLFKELQELGYEIYEYTSNSGYHCTKIKWNEK